MSAKMKRDNRLKIRASMGHDNDRLQSKRTNRRRVGDVILRPEYLARVRQQQEAVEWLNRMWETTR